MAAGLPRALRRDEHGRGESDLRRHDGRVGVPRHVRRRLPRRLLAALHAQLLPVGFGPVHVRRGARGRAGAHRAHAGRVPSRDLHGRVLPVPEHRPAERGRARLGAAVHPVDGNGGQHLFHPRARRRDLTADHRDGLGPRGPAPRDPDRPAVHARERHHSDLRHPLSRPAILRVCAARERRCGSRERPRAEQMIDQGRDTTSVRFVRTSLYLPMRLLFRIEHRGTENIPATGPLLITPNHVTYFDPFWVAVRVYRTLRFMTWDRALAVPVGGRILRWLGAFPVSLENPESSAYRASLRILRAGEALMIFPEGGRSPDGRLQPLKPGAARLALKTGATILPVAVLGGHEVWGPQLSLPRPRKVVVEFLRAFVPPAVEERDRAAFENAATEVTGRIRAALDEALARHDTGRKPVMRSA